MMSPPSVDQSCGVGWWVRGASCGYALQSDPTFGIYDRSQMLDRGCGRAKSALSPKSGLGVGPRKS
jgi:hypothetical protein